MIETVYLHIGMNKTGSSALQRFFVGNRDALLERGLLYPVTGCSAEAHYQLSVALGFANQGAHVDEGLIAALRAELENEARERGASAILISSESFVVPGDIDRVRAFFGNARVKVIVYLRRHDEWWLSAYNQVTKTPMQVPWDEGFDAYLAWQEAYGDRYWHYRAFLAGWERVFGRENLVVRPYECQQNQPDIITDFFAALGLQSLIKGLCTAIPRANESLSWACVDLLGIYRQVAMPKQLRETLIRETMARREGERRSAFISPAMRRQLIDAHQADYEFIAREYLGRCDGRLFLDPLPDADDTVAVPQLSSAAEAVEWTLRVLRPNAFRS